MRVEVRRQPESPRRLVLIAESEAESRALDEVFGCEVDADGLIGTLPAECRLSDGYGEHYLCVAAPPKGRA